MSQILEALGIGLLAALGLGILALGLAWLVEHHLERRMPSDKDIAP